MKRHVTATLLALLVGSCAPRIFPYDPATYTDGIVFSKPDPYLLVSVAKDGSDTFTIKYLPSPTERYVLQAGGLGSLNPTLEDGWNLTGINLSNNTVQDLSGLIGALSTGASVMKFGVSRYGEGVTSSTGLPEGLYKLDLAHTPPRIVGPLRVVSPESAATSGG